MRLCKERKNVAIIMLFELGFENIWKVLLTPPSEMILNIRLISILLILLFVSMFCANQRSATRCIKNVAMAYLLSTKSFEEPG